MKLRNLNALLGGSRDNVAALAAVAGNIRPFRQSGDGKLLRLQQSCDGLDLVASVFRQASADRTAEIE